MSISNLKTSLIVGALAAIGASLCCVGPLVLLMLGISGAWVSHLSLFEPVRPLFIGLTVLFVGMAFRRLYLIPRTCEIGSPCADPRTIGRQRRLFWIVAAVLSALLSVPLLAPFFY